MYWKEWPRCLLGDMWEEMKGTSQTSCHCNKIPDTAFLWRKRVQFSLHSNGIAQVLWWRLFLGADSNDGSLWESKGFYPGPELERWMNGSLLCSKSSFEQFQNHPQGWSDSLLFLLPPPSGLRDTWRSALSQRWTTQIHSMMDSTDSQHQLNSYLFSSTNWYNNTNNCFRRLKIDILIKLPPPFKFTSNSFIFPWRIWGIIVQF